jgi:hypothetical protein
MHTATLLPDGTVLIVGGLTIPERGAVSVDTIERFFPSKNEIRTIGRLRQSRAAHTAELLDDGSVLVLGGFSQDKDRMKYLSSTEVIDLNEEAAQQ